MVYLQHEYPPSINIDKRKTMSKNLGDLIYPDFNMSKAAVIDAETGKTYSYSDLENLSNYVANKIVNYGLSVGDRVAIIDYNSIYFFAAYLGILKSGCVAVLASANLPDATLHYILEDSNTKLVLDQKTLNLFFDNYKEQLYNFESYQPTDTDPALILYTSGSTGRPKGVIHNHSSHKWVIEKRLGQAYHRNAKTLIAIPIYHINGLFNFELGIRRNSTIILLHKFTPELYVQSIERYKVHILATVPAILATVIPLIKEQNVDVTSVRAIYAAAAPITKKLFRETKEVFTNAFLMTAYGLTESPSGVFSYRNPKNLPSPELSVGYPITDVEIRLVNGVLQFKTPALMAKYTNSDVNEKFTEDGFFITNDLFRVDEDGFYYFVGRADDMFKSGGYAIYPRSIEVVLEEHPSVATAVVIGLDDEIKGQKPYCFVELYPGHTISEDDLRTHSLKYLQHYEVPRKFWVIDQMPKTDISKIDKKKLKDDALALLAIDTL